MTVAQGYTKQRVRRLEQAASKRRGKKAVRIFSERYGDGAEKGVYYEAVIGDEEASARRWTQADIDELGAANVQCVVIEYTNDWRGASTMTDTV